MSNIVDGAVVTFLCGGFLEGNRFLNGLTDAPVFGGVDLEIRPDEVNLTGAFWQCSQVADRIFTFACAGKIPGPRYLNGNTYDGSVFLVGDTLDPFSGTRWLVQSTNLSGDDTVTLWCQGITTIPTTAIWMAELSVAQSDWRQTPAILTAGLVGLLKWSVSPRYRRRS